MTCKTCGMKVSNSKGLIAIAIIEGVLLLCTIILLLLVCLAYPDPNLQNQSSGADTSAAQELTSDINSTAYYNECLWCPNYGYVTNATLKTWKAGGEEAKYTYELINEQVETYMSELENNLFEKNAFSTGKLIVYSRQYDGTVQNIALDISQENKEITVYAYTK